MLVLVAIVACLHTSTACVGRSDPMWRAVRSKEFNMNDVDQDLLFALRVLRKNPGFSLISFSGRSHWASARRPRFSAWCRKSCCVASLRKTRSDRPAWEASRQRHPMNFADPNLMICTRRITACKVWRNIGCAHAGFGGSERLATRWQPFRRISFPSCAAASTRAQFNAERATFGAATDCNRELRILAAIFGQRRKS